MDILIRSDLVWLKFFALEERVFLRLNQTGSWICGSVKLCVFLAGGRGKREETPVVTKVGFLCSQGKGDSVKIKLTPKTQTNGAFSPTQESLRINELGIAERKDFFPEWEKGSFHQQVKVFKKRNICWGFVVVVVVIVIAAFLQGGNCLRKSIMLWTANENINLDLSWSGTIANTVFLLQIKAHMDTEMLL